MSDQRSSIHELYAVWLTSRALWENSLQTPDERIRDACLDNVTRLIPMFSETDAHCLIDVLKKLRVWVRQRAPGDADMGDLAVEDWIVVSAIADLERMCDSKISNREKAF
jgi:hypothetical protein